MPMIWKDERGASAVIIAGLLIMLMGIAAVAIDGGQLFSERRQAQTGVDFAAMAALQSAISCPSPCTDQAAANNGAQAAMDVVQENLPGRVLGWGACVDPSRPAKFTNVATTTACVSFTDDFSEARVVLPDDNFDTSFGGVIGQDQVPVGAVAEAGQSTEPTTADVLPFAFGAGPHTCLFNDTPSAAIAPCTGPRDGNYGYLDIKEWVRPTVCSNGAWQARMKDNIKLGTDHLLTTWTSGDPIVDDLDACGNLSETPNQIEVQTGNATKEMTEALAGDSDSLLHCTGPLPGCAQVRTKGINNIPLWNYLTAGSCPGTDTRDEMIACLNSWSSGVIFSDTIANAVRFVAVPELTTYPSGNGDHTIKSLRPVYLNTIYLNCNATGCAAVFTPGQPPTGPCTTVDATTTTCGLSPGGWGASTRVNMITAYEIKLGMLPQSVVDNLPGSPGLRLYNLTE